MNKRFVYKICLIFLISLCPTWAFSDTKTVNVGWYIQSKYQEITTSGTPYGFNYDYLQVISEYADWKYNFILDSFENCMRMLEAGEVDIVGCIIKSPEREVLYSFPDIALGTSYRYLYTLETSPITIDNLTQLENLKISVINNSVNGAEFLKYSKENNLKQHTIVGAENTIVMENMLKSGSIDAIVSGTLPTSEDHKLLAEFAPQPFYFALNKNRTDLLDDINNALFSIRYDNPNFTSELATKYDLINKDRALFTPLEKDIIKSLPTLTVAWSPLWTPLEIEDKKTGEFTGYIRDLFDQISTITGIQFDYIKCNTIEEALSLSLASKIDIISLYEGNDLSARQQGLYLTDSIISLPVQVIKKNEIHSIKNKVGILHSEKLYNSLKTIFSHELVRFSTMEEALDAVKKEEIAFLVTNSYAVHYYLQNHKYSNLYAVTLQDDPVKLRVAVSNKLPVGLISIIEKSLASIPSSTQSDLLIQSSIKNIKSRIDNIIELMDLIPSPIMFTILLFFILSAIIFSILLQRKIQYSQFLKTQLYTDKLTGLLSKEGFDYLVSRKLEKSSCDDYCIISFDMEHFEHYNALFGFEAGDVLLKDFGKICTKFSPRDELCAHLNSDHFVIFANEKDLSAEQRIEQIKKEVQKNHKDYKIFLNFGIYRLSTGLAEPAKMRDYSNAALRTVKTSSTKYIGYYDQELHNKLIQDSIISSEMEKALQNNEFVAYFQPKYGCNSEKPVGAEALVRWKKKNGEIVSPSTFIPLFEKNGFILKLDMYIFEKACEVLATQIAKGIEPVPISTNFSRVHMYNKNFAKNLAEIAGKHNIPPFLLEIEITESAFSSNQQLLLSLIESLHGYGFLVSIDDFGSGYSSLNLIKELKFDVIKIDQVFFRNNGEIERTKSVIQCIIQLAKELGMRTVAEGVETEAQFKFLKESKCDTIQGFYFSKPLEETIFTQLLASSDSADT